jgi:hypothetical protein
MITHIIGALLIAIAFGGLFVGYLRAKRAN